MGAGTLINQLNAEVADFRSNQLARIEAGKIDAAHVLTKGNLGKFGESWPLTELDAAYREGKRQIRQQSYIAALLVLPLLFILGNALRALMGRASSSTLSLQRL